ncbi:TetR/AcrR family transcriptional regulator [Gordonia araii NBRC 100433]|nr:TetR/AcrR family transcriptional regulator [Gordonia araii NBRC 100433]
MESVATPTGRRSGPSTARDDILAAARDLFAKNGFASTSMRAVATRANVDVALIPYYFANKRGLFVAAMELPIDPGTIVAQAATGPRDQLGRRLVTSFVTVWDDELTGTALQGFLRAAISDDAMSQNFGGFVSDAMVPLASAEIGVSTDTVRAVVSMLFGLATMRYLVGVPAFAEPSGADLIEVFAPRVQAVIDAE